MIRWRKIAREVLLLVVLVAAAMSVADWFRAPQAPLAFDAQPLQTLDGQQISLAELSRKRPLLLYFWGSWCGVCRYTTPAVAKLAANGGNVLSVALRSGDDRRLQRWLNGHHYAMPTVNDEQGRLSMQWRVSVTPTLVIIDRGQVVSATTGWTSGWGMRLRLWWAEKTARSA